MHGLSNPQQQQAFATPRAPFTQPAAVPENRKKRPSTASGQRPNLETTPSNDSTNTTELPLTPSTFQKTESSGLQFSPFPSSPGNLHNFSPSFAFPPIPPNNLSDSQNPPDLSSSSGMPNQQSPSNLNTNIPGATPTDSGNNFDPMFSMPTPAPYEQQAVATPSAASATGSAHTDPDKDPFLSLLEQLAENEVSRGGPSELDFFLSRTG